MRAGDHCQVGPRHCRPQKGGGAGTAAAIARGGEIGADTIPFTKRDITAWHLRLVTDIGKGSAQRVMIGAGIADLHEGGANATSRGRLDAVKGAGNVAIGPSLIAGCRPVVIITGLAPMIDQRVDRARPAENLAARVVDAAPAELGLWLGIIHPVDRLLVKQDAIADRHLDPEAAVRWSGLEQQDMMLATGGQPFSQNAAG